MATAVSDIHMSNTINATVPIIKHVKQTLADIHKNVILLRNPVLAKIISLMEYSFSVSSTII